MSGRAKHAHERFTEQVITTQETERRRLAGDIHDGISQRLARHAPPSVVSASR